MRRCWYGLDDKDGIRMKGVAICVCSGGGGRIGRGDEDGIKIQREEECNVDRDVEMVWMTRTE